MRVKTLFLLTVGLLPALASCGVPIRSGAHFSQGADVRRPLTFSWYESGDREVGDPRLVNNSFFEDRLHEAIEWELSLRGIRRVESGSDLLVHHHLSLENHEMVDEVVDESGYGRPEVYTYEEGTVVVHVTDARTRENVWLGWSQANVEAAVSGPDNMRRWVYNVVREMFRDWPTLSPTGS